MENFNNGGIILEPNSKKEFHKQLLIKRNNKLINQRIDSIDPLISKISKLINSKRMISQSSYKHLLEYPVSMTNQDLQKRKIDRIKENIANNLKQNRDMDMDLNLNFNLNPQLNSNLDLDSNFDQEQKSRGKKGSVSKHKNHEFLTFECFEKEDKKQLFQKNEKKEKILKNLKNLKNENNQVKLNFRDMIQQMRIKSSNNLFNRIPPKKIIFKKSKINQKNNRNNHLNPNNNNFNNFNKFNKFNNSNNNQLNLAKNKGNLGILIQSNNHLTGMRPETTAKVNSTKNLVCDRPLSRFNKNSLFAKIESNTYLKEECFFPIKNMNLVLGSENQEILPQSWK